MTNFSASSRSTSLVVSAQERMNELEAKMENMLSTVEKVFKVELMKMPPALQSTLIGDLISGESSSSSGSWVVVLTHLSCYRGGDLSQRGVHRHEGEFSFTPTPGPTFRTF